LAERKKTMSKKKAVVGKRVQTISTAAADLEMVRKSKSKPDLKPFSKFDVTKLSPALKRSPVKLRDWLDRHIPWFVGPRVDALEPVGGQRGTIITVHGARFAANRTDNEVTINGLPVPVMAASTNTLKVLVTKDVDTGLVEVKVGTRTSASPYAFTVKGYPGAGEDGPPVLATGAGNGAAGDVNPIGTIRVMVVLCQATDRIPANLATVRTALTQAWNNVHTFYDQASFTRTNVQFDIAAAAATLDGVFTDFVDLSATVQNIKGAQLGRIAAFAAQQAQNEGFVLNNYQMLCSVMFTNGDFIRAWGGTDTQTFSYDNGKPVGDPARIHIDITLAQKINELWIQETANWGRFAHEFGHNIVSAPTVSGDGTATLGEDVYGSDLVDASAATAQDFELMGNHDSHPIFTGYHLEKLGYYQGANVRELNWDRNPHSEEVDVIAHGVSEDADPNRVHIVKIKVSDALTYYVEVRQRPGATAQIFDDSIPTGGSANQGGVIVTRVIAGEMNNNQQTRFITLMHEDRVQINGDIIEDPARALRITVVNDSVQARPLVCKVRVEWANTIANDPGGAFDLKVEPWDGNYQSPDIWVDRDPIGTFDNPMDAQGRPTGNGDKPWVNHINQFTARVHVSGAIGATNVKVTFYAISPPGVGDNGNWSPIAVKTIANIPASNFMDTFCNWVPVVDKHTCLKVFASQQLGEISGDNNGAQENVFDFQAAGSSPADPLFIKTAIRNPLDERRAIQVSLRGLPLGWVAQVPHAWLWLDGKAEKEIDVMIWPIADVNAYQFGKNREGKLPGLAPVKVAGFVERSYTEAMGSVLQVVGSRFYPIGGTFYRVGVRKRGSIRLEAEGKNERKDSIRVQGVVAPPRADQRVLIDALLPDGKTHRTTETRTNATGQFSALLKVTDDNKKLLSGPYVVQGFIHNASELSDAESNVVTVLK
jgi:hypothetical protein